MPDPPVTECVPFTRHYHGHAYVDQYAWLQDASPRRNPKIMAHLGAETAYMEASLLPQQDLEETIYKELLDGCGTLATSAAAGQLTLDRADGPMDTSYLYGWRRRPGLTHPVYIRRPAGRQNDERVVLDLNEPRFSCAAIHRVAVSPDHRWLAFVIATTGADKLSLYFYHIRSRTVSPRDVVHNVAPTLAWADARTLLYCTPTTGKRPGQVYRHTLGTRLQQDMPILENHRPEVTLSVRVSASGAYVFIDLWEPTRSECHFIPAPAVARGAAPTRIQPFTHRLRYTVEHQGPHFVILGNRQGDEPRINGQVFYCPVVGPEFGCAAWRPLRPYDSQTLVEQVVPFAHHLALVERARGQVSLRVLCGIDVVPGRPARFTGTVGPDAAAHRVPIPAGTTRVAVSPTAQGYHSNRLRFTAEGPQSPVVTYEYDLDRQARRPMFPSEERSEPDADDGAHLYTVERLAVDLPHVRDPLYLAPPRYVKIPVTLVYRADRMHRDGSNPAVILVDGVRGEADHAGYAPHWRPLLDRGFVVAVAHVRGGCANGRAWHEVYGRLLQRKSGAYDLLAVANALVKRRYTSAHRTAVLTLSPDEGLTAAAALNLKPQFFRAAVLHAPATDPLNALMTDDAPAADRDELGDPTTDTTIFQYLISYAPYDRVAPRRLLPHILCHATLDGNYWQAAKWVSRLRAAGGDPHDRRETLLAVDLSAAPDKLPPLGTLARDLAFLVARLEDTVPALRTAPLIYSSRRGLSGSREIDFDATRTSCGSQS
ncbi:hypothetical protein IWQ60_004840 [Tieghemiomyces parasiticus]|uniref:Prolyl endopeptidase-like n=1 Tax=Tieghemiomyces parasiticus TaxID=78921 RepID=A0A9W8DTK0_9FUNG|nr:hypothetical protein IWQ60_004840 [Tieghemiomyces parasiticus]